MHLYYNALTKAKGPACSFFNTFFKFSGIRLKVWIFLAWPPEGTLEGVHQPKKWHIGWLRVEQSGSWIPVQSPKPPSSSSCSLPLSLSLRLRFLFPLPPSPPCWPSPPSWKFWNLSHSMVKYSTVVLLGGSTERRLGVKWWEVVQFSKWRKYIMVKLAEVYVQSVKKYRGHLPSTMEEGHHGKFPSINW